MSSNVKVDNDLPQVSAAQDHVNYPNAQVKTEAGFQQHPAQNYPQVQAYTGGGYDNHHGIAQQRAQTLVMQRQQQNNMMPQSNFPNLSQQNLHLPQQGQHPMQTQQQRMMAPQQHQQQQQQHQQQPQQRLPQQLPQQRPPQQQNNLYNSQTDGAGEDLEDWKAFLAARRAAETAEGRIAADEFMRARVDAMAMQQDSGLMVPLDSMPKGKKRRAAVRVLQAEQAGASSSTTAPCASAPGLFDGPDDDIKPGEEDPDDAINSDLDDPEDDTNDGDNSDDEMVDYMLCTYDKVQRVKNKWKCTLKDGILTTNKKE